MQYVFPIITTEFPFLDAENELKKNIENSDIEELNCEELADLKIEIEDLLMDCEEILQSDEDED